MDDRDIIALYWQRAERAIHETAAKYGGKCNLRYDDTNPVKEDVEYVDAIEEDVKWLGLQWDKRLWASDYFDTMYDAAVELIKKGMDRIEEMVKELK